MHMIHDLPYHLYHHLVTGIQIQHDVVHPEVMTEMPPVRSYGEKNVHIPISVLSDMEQSDELKSRERERKEMHLSRSDRNSSLVIHSVIGDELPLMW